MELAYNNLWLSVPRSVYVPAEDSFMLADAVRSLRGKVLELGCGCGIASLACSNADSVVGVDINPEAVRCAKENAAKNGISNVSFAESDLFSKVEGRFDAILFNPPYLPTSADEHVAGPLDTALDGGEDGRAVLDRFLNEFDSHMRPGGVLLLVQSSLNDLEKTRSVLEGPDYIVSIKEEQNFFFERLYLLQASKK